MKRSLIETKTKKKVNKSNTCESFIMVNKNFSNILDEVNVHSINYDDN
jgi:molecular chaperone GrpE (heat shock protein)